MFSRIDVMKIKHFLAFSRNFQSLKKKEKVARILPMNARQSFSKDSLAASINWHETWQKKRETKYQMQVLCTHDLLCLSIVFRSLSRIETSYNKPLTGHSVDTERDIRSKKTRWTNIFTGSEDNYSSSGTFYMYLSVTHATYICCLQTGVGIRRSWMRGLGHSVDTAHDIRSRNTRWTTIFTGSEDNYSSSGTFYLSVTHATYFVFKLGWGLGAAGCLGSAIRQKQHCI